MNVEQCVVTKFWVHCGVYYFIHSNGEDSIRGYLNKGWILKYQWTEGMEGQENYTFLFERNKAT